MHILQYLEYFCYSFLWRLFVPNLYINIYFGDLGMSSMIRDSEDIAWEVQNIGRQRTKPMAQVRILPWTVLYSLLVLRIIKLLFILKIQLWLSTKQLKKCVDSLSTQFLYVPGCDKISKFIYCHIFHIAGYERHDKGRINEIKHTRM